MNEIWQYNLKYLETQTIKIPFGFTVMDIQMNFGIPVLWVLVDPQQDKTEITITKHHNLSEVSQDKNYIGTVQGDYVQAMHFFSQ